MAAIISSGCERGRHEAGGEIRERHLPDAADAGDMDDGVVGGADRRQFGGRIGVRKTAADGAAIAGLAMADMAQRLAPAAGNACAISARRFELALARHGADAQPAVADRDAAQVGDAAEIDEMIDDHVAEIHHRHERLPARQNLGVGQRRQQLGRLLELPRRVIVERSWLHWSRSRLAYPIARKGRKLLQKSPVFAVTDPTIEAC